MNRYLAAQITINHKVEDEEEKESFKEFVDSLFTLADYTFDIVQIFYNDEPQMDSLTVELDGLAEDLADADEEEISNAGDLLLEQFYARVTLAQGSQNADY